MYKFELQNILLEILRVIKILSLCEIFSSFILITIETPPGTFNTTIGWIASDGPVGNNSNLHYIDIQTVVTHV